MGLLDVIQHGLDSLQHGWNAFINNRDPTTNYYPGPSYYYRPDRTRLSRGNERSIITSIFNRIALDVAQIDIRHVRLDENGRYIGDVKSGLNECLTVEANLDQSGRSFKQDIVMSMLDEGCIAVVPVDTTINPKVSGSYDIQSMRTAKIVEWYPSNVKVRVYNEKTGKQEDVILPKKMVAILENPLYAVINEPNSVLQRLIRKLNLLDAIDEQSGSGKLDLIIQLPYVVKTDARRAQAKARLKDIEDQLKGPYGIAYTDGTEKVTQLNRPIENNLMKQIEYLTSMLHSQLGITQAVMDGTADEQTMLNYQSKSIEHFVTTITDAFRRTFLTKTARSQGQSIMAFRDIFKLATIGQIASAADIFCRNEITTSNEWRQVIGFKPSLDPRADQLRNSNMPQNDPAMIPEDTAMEPPQDTRPFGDVPIGELMQNQRV